MGSANVVGGLLSSYATFSKGVEEQKDLEYASAASERNARMQDFAAGSALDQGVAQQAASRMKYAAVKGEQQAALGASGVSVSSGSALDILAGTDAISDYDSAVIRDNAAREAWALKQQAKESRLQSKLLKEKGEKAGLNTALSTAGQLSSVAGGR